MRLVEQTEGRSAHHEGGHQVFEHGPGPRDQGGATTDGRQRTAEPEPVIRGDIPLGDRQKASEACLGGEEVVVARIQRALLDPKTDREELAGRVEQEAEVHLPEKPLGLVGDRLQSPHERRRSRRSAARFADRRIGHLGDRREGGHPKMRLKKLEVSNMTAHGQPSRLGPGHQIAPRSLSTLCGESRGDVRERLGVCG